MIDYVHLCAVGNTIFLSDICHKFAMFGHNADEHRRFQERSRGCRFPGMSSIQIYLLHLLYTHAHVCVCREGCSVPLMKYICNDNNNNDMVHDQ